MVIFSKRLVTMILLALMLIILSASMAFSASITLTVTPEKATANSVWVFTAVASDFKINPTPTLAVWDNPGMVMLGLSSGGGGNNNLYAIPMFYVYTNSDHKPVYKAAVSGGLNMSSIYQRPDGHDEFNVNYITPRDLRTYSYRPALDNNRVLWHYQQVPVWYSPSLAKQIVSPNPEVLEDVKAWAWDYDPSATEPPKEPVESNGLNITIHASRYLSAKMDFGGIFDGVGDTYERYGDRDYLTCYPDNYPYPTGVEEPDPLVVEPTARIDTNTPDVGSGNNDFIFQVRYNNLDGLPPLPWRNWFSPRRNETGVVLYLDKVGTNDYKMYPMYPVSGTEVTVPFLSQIYEHRFIPNDKEEPYDANGYTSFSNTDSLDCYVSLDTGIYHYFFACSDDSTKYFDETVWPFPCVTGSQPDKVEWGNPPDPYDSYPDSALDPRVTRNIIGNSFLDREAHRIYSSKDRTGVDFWPHFEDTILLDRPTRAPGMFETNWRYNKQYQFSCNEYPKVTCLLSMQGDKMDYKDTHSIRFDDKRYGYGRFWGTLEPFYRTINPTMAGCYKTVFDNDTSLCESSGTTTATDNVYRIMFKQLDGKAPTSIQVNITDTPDGTGTFKSYTMYPDPTKYTDVNKITPAQYKSGVWYNYKTKLAAGSHSYWFTANDGGQTAYWPNRPGTKDIFLPAANNDFAPGPYVNTAPILSNAKVTPGTGKQGGKYVYSVTYRDPDGQRPNSAYVYIQTNDKGNVRKCSMRPVTPLNPNGNNSAIYKAGVEYVFELASAENLVLETGVRKFYFQFTDDWGRQVDSSDFIPGETVRYPIAANSWIEGPVISSNQSPLLIKGSVESADGTANSASLWTFRTTYKDLENDAPTLMKVYIGQTQPDGKSILWDEGHDMLQIDPNDNIYNDGTDFYFQTRLSGKDSNGDAEKNYYYAFLAFDGNSWSTYRSSASDSLRSNAASCFELQDLTRIGNTQFKMMPLISQQGVVTDSTTIRPTNASDILRVAGVFIDEDLAGINYYDPAAASPAFAVGDETIKLTSPLPDSTVLTWIKYESQAPIVGPLLVEVPAPTGVITDASIFVDSLLNYTDDKKNGWNEVGDERFSMMKATATNIDDEASLELARPNQPAYIASVEGVYRSSDLTGTNYYEPLATMPRMMQTGSIDPADSGRTTLIPSDHRNIADVVGVFVTTEITGTNYLAPAGMSADYKISLNMAPPAGISSMYILYRPALNQTGSLDMVDSSRKTIIPSYKPQVTDVLGVFDNPNFTGINYAAGNLNAQGKLPLNQAFPIGPTPYIKYVWNEVQKGNLFVDPALSAPYMAIAEDVSKIGEVTGVYNNPGLIGTNFLAMDLDQRGRITLNSNPGVDTLYIKYRRTGYNSTSQTISLTRVLPALDEAGKPLAGTTLYVKYSDLRFTHQIRGEVVGKDIFSPDGGTNARIKGNVLDPTGGMVGIWTDQDRTSFNYFDPRRVPYTDRVPGVADQFIDISSEISAGTMYAWARYYQKGDFNIDRWNRIVEFFNPPADGVPVQSTYMFGSKLPQTVGANTAPELLSGKLTPLKGTQSTQYVYTVIYRDNDGANGQAPEYVRVVIDGVAHNMSAVSQAAPIYREGAEYSYTTTGLSGGSHKFYFTTSDGADVALYDWYTRNNSTRPTSGETIKTLDGPWVNELPTLTSGKVNPNPTTGITTQDGVEYSVVYADPENDEPYFYNSLIDRDSEGKPIGVNMSGSPRLFIDNDSNDIDLGVIKALEADPIVASKKRTIVVENDPKWPDNKFAGRPMQISSGAQNGRVYLIQGNTHNKIIISTEDLSKDGITQGTTFRINGLLMAKADLTQYDYRTGVLYKITVPKLGILKNAAGAVISHKFRFTACSRENKPAWLNDPVPYSATVEFAGTGPKVNDSIPTGNTAPVLTPVSALNPVTLFAGPRVQQAKKQDTNTVVPFDNALFGEIRAVTGVYTSANMDADKVTPVNYYVPANASGPFTNGDKTITLTQSLPNITEGTVLVQFGSVSTQLNEVTPERPDVIKTIVGIYTNPALTGTNYYNAATSTFVDGKIINATALPDNTEQVYVQYGVMANVDWPLYVEYFAEYNAQTVFLAGQPLTFMINYNDLDDNPPAYHDSVQGYLKVVFTGKTEGSSMLPLNPPVSSFISAVPFTVTTIDIPEGTNKYHFEASDGYYTARYPAAAADDYTIKINNRPVISNPGVDPTSGRDITKYTFTATYADKDGIAPNVNDVIVRLQLKTDSSVQRTYKMSVDPTETTPNYVSGVKYVATTDQVTAIPTGTYTVTFEAKDAYQAAKTVAGHDLFIRNTNNAPVIKSVSVAPPTGKLATNFTYKAVYFDADNDAPVVLKPNGDRIKALKLIIDDKASAPYYMTTSAINPDYSLPAGVEFKFTIAGNTLGIGKHKYEIKAFDGDKEAVMDTGVLSVQQGPVVLVPTFENFRVLLRDNADIATGITRAIVGDKIIIKGQMRFTYTDFAAAPSKIDQDINILLVKPDGGSASVRGSVISFAPSGKDAAGKPLYMIGDVVAVYSTGEPKGDATLVSGDSFSLTSNGTWKVSASWEGNTVWDGCQTPVVNIEVGGPERTFAVKEPAAPATSLPLIDMITPPMYIGLPDSADVGIVFGYQRAMDMQVVKWDPASRTYLQYGAGGSFAIAPGDAVWIRPKATIATEAVNLEDIISGRLISGNPGSAINSAYEYRVISINGRDYPVQTDADGKPVVDATTGKVKLKTCTIDLTRGWNQVGSIFFNWFKDADGFDIMPRVDVGIPVSELKVTYLGETKTFANAAIAGWVKDFAWRWDASKNKYVLVHATAEGAEKTVKAWNGYWIRALVDCKLIIDPNTTYNGN